jgi:hypothetical protein
MAEAEAALLAATGAGGPLGGGPRGGLLLLMQQLPSLHRGRQTKEKVEGGRRGGGEEGALQHGLGGGGGRAHCGERLKFFKSFCFKASTWKVLHRSSKKWFCFCRFLKKTELGGS